MHTTIYIAAGAPEQYTEVYYIILRYITLHSIVLQYNTLQTTLHTKSLH